MDQSYEQLSVLLNVLSDPLSDVPDEGGWTIRQLLSHLAGAYQRVPIHSGFVLGGNGSVPILFDDAYWIPEWENAPLNLFQRSIEEGSQGCKAFVASPGERDLELRADTRFGEMTLGAFLMVSFGGHIGRFHLPQLAAVTAA